MGYEIEITRFAPALITEKYIGTTTEDAARHLSFDTDCEFVVFIAALERERNLDWGNFYVWCNAGRALIRLDEHCEHRAIDSQLANELSRDIWFRDEDGSRFSVLYQQTVSCRQALNALRFWLPFQKQTPELVWS